MSKQFKFKCDLCEKQVPAYYNGEHWLPPSGWMQIYDLDKAKTIDVHLCDKCLSKILKEQS